MLKTAKIRYHVKKTEHYLYNLLKAIVQLNFMLGI